MDTVEVVIGQSEALLLLLLLQLPLPAWVLLKCNCTEPAFECLPELEENEEEFVWCIIDVGVRVPAKI